MVYQPLPIITVPLGKLQLDLDNYRIPTHRDDEAAALNYLFSAEDAIGSAKEILRDGYFDNEVPIVMKAPGGYIVLEGNRRVSALKAMADPTIVPTHESEILTFLKRYAVEAANLPSEIRVIVAPDRDTAGPHIARLHTGLSKKGWSRDQQANYYYSLLGPGTTVDDVKRQHGGQTVTRFMKMAVMRRMLAGVKFSDKSLHEYVTGSNLAMSSFEYAFGKKDIAEAIGAIFTKDGLLAPSTMKPEQVGASLSAAHRAAMEYLIGEFRADKLNTRSAALRKGTPQYEALVNRLTGQSPASPAGGAGGVGAATPPGSGSGGTGSGGAAPAGAPSGTAAPAGGTAAGGQSGPGSQGPNHPNTKVGLLLGGLDFTHASVNLNNRYQELRKMKLSEVPSATAMYLRSILETTIKFHFENTPTPASGQLSDCVMVLEKAYGTEKPIKAQIAQIRSGKADVPGSIAWFNHVCHSADAIVTPNDIRQAWALMNPVLRRLLRPAAGASV